MDVGFENTYTVAGKWNVYLGLFQEFMDGYLKFLKLLPLLVQLRVLSRETRTQQGPSQWL